MHVRLSVIDDFRSLGEVNRIARTAGLSPLPLSMGLKLTRESSFVGFLAHAPQWNRGAVGFITGRSIPPEGEIHDIAVLPWCRTAGIGHRLLTRTLTSMQAAGVEVCYLEVRESNAQAIRFYERRGFECQGIRRKYYNNPIEDARVLAWKT